MNKNINLIISYTEGKLSKRKMNKFESELKSNRALQQDYRLYIQVNETMQGKKKLEEVRNDPALHILDPLIKLMITDFKENPENYGEARKFVKDALDERKTDVGWNEEINQIKQEISELGLNEMTGGWIKEWREKTRDNGTKDPHTNEIRDFIRQSLEAEKNNSGLKIVHKGNSLWGKSLTLRITSIAAAILIAGVILIKILVPSYNPEKLYYSYYKPMSLISPVTRGLNSDLLIQYSHAIDMYNQGKYTDAAVMFNAIILKDNMNLAPYFYLGLAQMELSNFSGAISNLAIVESHQQEFMKEAQWYLGLSYLKTGEKTKAIPYFEILSKSEGYYQDQAKVLLRRVKSLK